MEKDFLDSIKINVKAGGGGSGCISFRREKFVPRGGPDGGNGGNGGDIILKADGNLYTLMDFRYKVHYKGERGVHGKGSMMDGRCAEGLVLRVPRGTLVFDDASGDLLADLVEEGQQLVAAKGGRGGRGNASFMNSFHKAPRFSENGEPGEERWLKLELKLLADVGIVGFPNAGKSTLLSKISRATPKIADYPFTTLVPNLGTTTYDDGERIIVADIPGLMEGAHEGKGLGDKFLRHIERTKVVLHLIDLTQVDPENPQYLYDSIRRELTAYNPAIAARPEVIGANKVDIPRAQEIFPRLKECLEKRGLTVLPISAREETGLDDLLAQVRRAIAEAPLPVVQRVPVVKPKRQGFTIAREGRTLRVVGKGVERMVTMTNMEHDDGVAHLQRRLKRMGVEDALRRAGAVEGDTVTIGAFEFTYTPD